MNPQINLTFVGSLNCEGYSEYPYYPIVAAIQTGDLVYLAIKSHLGFCLQTVYLKDRKLHNKAYMVQCEGLPENKSITAMEFVRKEVAEQGLTENVKATIQSNPSAVALFILIGFSSGHLCLAFIQNYKGVVIKRFNTLEPPQQNNILNRTLSYFTLSGRSKSSYEVWQKFGVMKITARKSLTYLLRNNIIVHTFSFFTALNTLQRNFSPIMNFEGENSNQIMIWNNNNKESCYNITTSQFKQVWDDNGFILAFNSNISNYMMDEKLFFVSTFEGVLFIFDRNSLLCVNKVNTSAAIRHIYCYKGLVALSLQDDSVDIFNIEKLSFCKLSGHRSFASQTAVLKGHFLVSSFDGTLSLTKIPPQSMWQSAKSPQNALHKEKEIRVQKFIKIGKEESGIGAFHIISDFLICSMQDYSIQIFHLSY